MTDHTTPAPTACALCRSVNLTDLGHGSQSGGTVICQACGAHWWRVWRTAREWERWVNGADSAEGAEQGRLAI
jgi:hypothetical protein